MKNNFCISSLFLSIILLTTHCKKETIPQGIVPVINATEVSSINSTTAISGGNILIQGSSSIIARGVCWSTDTIPTLANYKTTDGSGTGSFSSNLSGLTSNTTYYLRAYATNSSGTGYSDQLSFATTGSFANCGIVTDIDGNIYNTVTIGTQCWLNENLKTTHYNDGTAIPTGLNDAAWQATTSEAYAIYNNNIANNTIYGKLYNWYAVNTGKLAPAGWHVPTDAEWTTLTDFLGGEAVAGNKMKATTKWALYSGVVNTNSSGLSVLPAGYRGGNGTYVAIGIYGYFWSSTDASIYISSAWARPLSASSSEVSRNYGNKANGFSVRCIKD